MSDLARLKAALRRTAEDGLAPRGAEVFDRPEDGAAIILGHVDRSMLGRRLGFRFDDGTGFDCEASGRRLIRLLPPEPPGLEPAGAALFDGAELRPEQGDLLAATLVTLCGGRTSLRMSSEPLGDAADPSQGGIDTSGLFERLGQAPADLAQGAEGGDLDALVAEIGGDLLSGLLIDGEEVTPIRGDGEDADRISPWAVDAVERLLAPDFPLAMALETDGIMAFGLKGSTERHLVVAGRLGRLLVGVVSGADPAETLVRWQRARR